MQREEDNVNMGTQVGVPYLGAKECQGLPATPEDKREAWNGFSLTPQKEPTLPIPCLWTSGIQNCGRINFWSFLVTQFM